jgi:hypothetical protein
MLAVLVSVVNQHETEFADGVMTRLTIPEKPPTLAAVIVVCRSEPRGII